MNSQIKYLFDIKFQTKPEMLKIAFILLISPIFLVIIKCDRVETDETVTLNSLEDIEVLTYFLLWKYDYFQNNFNPEEINFQINHQDSDNQNGIDIEPQLRLFIENLKENKLIQHITNSSSVSFDNTIKSCDNIDKRLMKRWQRFMSANKIKNICEAASGCKSAKQLVQLIDINTKESPNPKTLMLSQSIVRLCPLMLFQLQEQQCIKQRESHYEAQNRPHSGSVWGFAILFVTIVSFCSLIGVAILPLLTKSTYDIMLTLFEGLAVGSLVGSAIFHLIPQAFNLSQTGSKDYLWRALIIFGGIYLFFWSERIMKIFVDLRRKQKLSEPSMPSFTSVDTDQPKLMAHKQVLFKDYDMTNGTTKVSDTSVNQNTANSSPQSNIDSENERNDQTRALTVADKDDRNDSLILESLSRERNRTNSFSIKHGHSHGGDSHTEIATVAWMIIFGDGLHNFIDGITIGAAFSQSILEGISISVAVICEEFPHELGDFAVLIASGMTMRQALGYNFLSACTCYIGMVVGIFLGDMADASPYVFALAAGMFLYIALVDMMGELQSAVDKASLQGMSQTFKIILLQNVGILLGICSLLFLAKYGEKINFEGLAPLKSSDIPFTE